MTAKPIVKWGRKATGLMQTAGLQFFIRFKKKFSKIYSFKI